MKVYDRIKQIDDNIRLLEEEKRGLTQKKKYIFMPGDVALYEGDVEVPRIIVEYNNKLIAFSVDGRTASTGQKDFEYHNYKYVGKLRGLIKEFKNGSNAG